MNSIRFLALPAVAAAIVSCAPQKNSYDTSNPYGTPDGGGAVNAPYQAGDVANPVYDTPAAYEDGGDAVTDPAGVAPAMPAGASSGAAATAHVVVKGDTLSGIANKYKVPMASIKKANHMTKDIVVLGKTLIIPAH